MVSTTTRQTRRPAPVEAPDEGANLRARYSASLKAGIAGAFGMALLLLVSLVDVPLVTCLVVPGFLLVFGGSGILAGILAGDAIQTRSQATQVGAIAGFVSGLGGGVTGMALAAFGLIPLFVDLGAGVQAQFTAVQLRSLAQSGITGEVVRQAGAVLWALALCGAGGTGLGVLLGALGGRIYSRLR
jgi:hypothetical protein